MAPEKINSYNAYLLSKRDNYVNHLIRVGSKLLKKGEFNPKSFSKNFIIDKDEIIKKIEGKVKYETDTQHGIATAAVVANREKQKKKDNIKTCFDSQLIDILRPHIDNFTKEMNEVIQNCDCSKEEDESNESMTTVIDCESSGDRMENNNKATVADKEKDDDDNDEYCVSQELMPGECSKIFVQKSRIDVIRSKMDDIDFENDLIETIYVFRRKNC